jgi:1-phosphatidylinositol-4-phosphate 5-kinase
LDTTLEEFHKRLACAQEKSKFNFMTADSEFTVKTISSKELMCLKSMIQDYSRHLKCEKGSYLAKIFGLFKIKIEGSKAIRVIIIENQGSCLLNPIKFHLDGRLGLKADSLRGQSKDLEGLSQDVIYEDKDFFECIGAFNVSNVEHEKIMKKLKRDTKFLMKHLVVDYSLNVLTENNTCIKQSIIQKDVVTVLGKYIVFIGIIGFLQGYDVTKKMNKIGKKRFEKYFKSDEYCPKSYRKRFLFMAKNLFKVLNVN